MSYTLVRLDAPAHSPDAGAYVLGGLEGSTPCAVRGLSRVLRGAWDAAWGAGVGMANSADLRVIPDGTSPATPWHSLSPLLVRSPVPVAFATLEAGALVMRDALGARIMEVSTIARRTVRVKRPPPHETATLATADDVTFTPRSPVVLSALAPTTLAHTVAGLVVAAPDGSTYDGDDVWRLWRVASTDSGAYVPSAGITVPPSTPAAVIVDAWSPWGEGAVKALRAGRAVTVTVEAVAADGVLWFGAGEGVDAPADAGDAGRVAMSSGVVTWADLSAGAGTVAYCTSANPTDPGAVWRLAEL